LQALVARTGIDPTLMEDCITGCVIQVAEQAGNIGRQAVLAAGLPESIPGGDARQQVRLGAAGDRFRCAGRDRRRL
jgi:acetyl-CoA acetyltransferase